MYKSSEDAKTSFVLMFDIWYEHKKQNVAFISGQQAHMAGERS
jgi:hypothetical protein